MAKENHMNINEKEIKAVAKAAGAALTRAGHEVPHSALLHALAAALNRRDWHKLKASLGAKVADDTAEKPVTALPAKNQEITLLWQGRGDGTVQGFEINGMLVVPSEEGVTYVRREDAKAFFGLQEPPTELRKTLESVRSYLETPGDLNSEEVKYLLEDVEISIKALPLSGGEPSVAGLHHELPRPVRPEALEGPAASAKFWTDDRVCEVTFDCRPYLAQASDEALKGILEADFWGSEWTDAVAEFNYGNKDLHDAFTYLSTVQRSQDIGFECRVDREQFLRWMEAHRSGALAEVLCEKAGVLARRIKEAEREDGNEWGWERLEDGTIVADSQDLFATKREACLDAYRELGLLEQEINQQL